MYDIEEGIEVLLIFLGMSTPIIVIGLIYYLKKRFEHKQIMAAIEKGMPLPELKPVKVGGPLWIKNLTAGITLLIITAGIVFIGLAGYDDFTDFDDVSGWFVVGVVLFAVGVSRIIRGLLQRKAEKTSDTRSE